MVSTPGVTYRMFRALSEEEIKMLDPTDDGFADNLEIETQADSILDFTEQNPFGTP